MSESSHSFFEGPEKKVELVAHPSAGSLRERDTSLWQEVVRAANASILSTRSNDFFDAYLLSESSLFVFPDHATMITCGRTTLVTSVIKMIEEIGTANIALLVYERKNEHFPTMQHSSFRGDVALLRRHVDGRALRFGVEHAHRIDMFVSGLDYKPDKNDVTLEVLMHGLDRDRAKQFRGDPKERSARTLGLDALVEGGPFLIDEYAFRPAGYSLNALSKGTYYTVHVTPEDEGSYASFETNVDFRSDPSALVARVVSAFEPESFDVLAFAPIPDSIDCQVAGYLPFKQVHEAIAGYEVSFRSFFRPQGLERATEL